MRTSFRALAIISASASVALAIGVTLGRSPDGVGKVTKSPASTSSPGVTAAPEAALRQRDPRQRSQPSELGKVECRDTFCRVELSVRPFELSRSAGSADFRIAQLDMAAVADAGFRLTAYLYPSAEESSNQAATAAVANAP